MRNTADMTGGKPIAVLLQSISGVSANPLVTFKTSMEERERCFYFIDVLDYNTLSLNSLFHFSYDTMIRATGRYFCTFLQSVDNIHQRMRFTFPRMRSPSMQLTRAHRLGAELVYSSTRTGFTHYLMGEYYTNG
jgi:hypothetical protein